MDRNDYDHELSTPSAVSFGPTSLVRFIRSEFGQVELGDGQILLDAVTEPGVTLELFSEARTIRPLNNCLRSVASVLMGW